MKSSTKIILGILSIIPLIGFVYFFSSFISIIFELSSEPPQFDNEGPGEIIRMFIGPYIAMFFCMLINMAMMVTFIVFAIKDRSATESDKVLWVLLIVFLSLFINPIYWLIRVWNNADFSIDDSPTDRTN